MSEESYHAAKVFFVPDILLRQASTNLEEILDNGRINQTQALSKMEPPIFCEFLRWLYIEKAFLDKNDQHHDKYYESHEFEKHRIAIDLSRLANEWNLEDLHDQTIRQLYTTTFNHSTDAIDVANCIWDRGLGHSSQVKKLLTMFVLRDTFRSEDSTASFTYDNENFLNTDEKTKEAKTREYFKSLTELTELNKGISMGNWEMAPVEDFLMK